MDPIAEARQNPSVEALYQEVDAITPITVEVTDNKYWSSSTLNGATKIEVGRASDPAAAMMHELLHAQTKIAGFVQYSKVTTISDRGLRARSIVEALDNELQHHRMFPAFIAAGFKPKNFYSDEDKKTFSRVRRELRKMDKSDDLTDYFLKFLSVIAPSGHGTDNERAQLRYFLFQRCGPDKQAVLKQIEEEIYAWASGPLRPHRQLLSSILLKIGVTGFWFGTIDAEFPGGGFFIDDPFSEASAEVFLRRKGLM